MYPLTTTTARIDACNPCNQRRDRAARLLGITEPSDDPISYTHLLDTLGLDDALWCCQAEPHLAAIWRRYAVWCARQAQHLITDERSLDALNVAERHANGQATDQELAAAWDAASAAARDAQIAARSAAWAARNAAWAAASAAASATASATTWATASATASATAWDARVAARQKQADAFHQLVTTGTLPT
jgi:hypothetical protein